MPANKILVIIGASIESLEGIKTARAMNLTLAIVDANPNAPGMALADHKIVVSTYDGDAIVDWLHDNHIQPNGVIAMCADVPLSAAKVASAFDLPGISIESAICLTDKVKMKEQLASKGIPIPSFAEIKSVDDIHTFTNRYGFPVVIKPVDSCGARGVQFIESASQINNAFDHAIEVSPANRVMVEEFLSGPQISTETLIDHGRCYTLGFSDRNYEWLTETKPWMIENGGDAPSLLTETEQQAVTQLAEQAGIALGISSGVAKGDMVLTPEGPKVIEVAGRLSGGYFSTTQIPITTGINFISQAIKLALGEALKPSALVVKKRKGTAIRYLRIPRGKIKAIRNIEKANCSAGVQLLNMLVKPGDNIGDITNHVQRAGLVVCKGATKQQAIDRCNQALSHIEVVYE